VSELRLGARAARSGIVVAGGRIVQGIVSLASVAVLARLLTPSDFGVLAMVLPVALIVDMTINAGLHVAVMHEAQLSDAQVSRLFWIGQRFNALVLAAMALSAPLLAKFYGEPRVTAVALIWTAALAFHGLGAFPEALLKRHIQFGLLTAIEVGAMIVAVAVAIAAAALGWRNIALVLQVVTWNGLRCIGAFAAARWLPSRPRRAVTPDADIDRLVRYGASFGGSRAVYWLGRQADRMVVGYTSGAAILGLYDSARRWSWYPFQELFLSLTDVAIATLSRARLDAVRFRQYCRRGFTAFLALPMPAIAFVGLEADLVVRVLLGERWMAAVPMVRIMCGAAFVDSVGRLTSWLYAAEGRTREQLHWSVVSTAVTLVAVLGAAGKGAVGVTWAFALATIALAVPGIAYCLRTSVLSAADFAAGVWRPVVATLLAASGWVVVRTWLPAAEAMLVRLTVTAIVFGAFYALGWVALPGGWRNVPSFRAEARSAGGEESQSSRSRASSL
jgi:PST family polysaccharide transporter